MITYNENLMGKMTIKQAHGTFEIEIRQGNCLAVFVHIRKAEDGDGYIHTLYNFFADEEHLKRIIKNIKAPFGSEEIVSLELNCKYKECLKMLKHLVKFYPINCYYA